MSTEGPLDVDGAFAAANTLREKLANEHRSLEQLSGMRLDSRHRVVRPGETGYSEAGPMVPSFESTRLLAERTKTQFDVAWAIYVEAARARDAQAIELLASAQTTATQQSVAAAVQSVEVSKQSVTIAEANREISEKLKKFTLVLAVAAIAQAVGAVPSVVQLTCRGLGARDGICTAVQPWPDALGDRVDRRPDAGVDDKSHNGSSEAITGGSYE